MRYHRLLSLVAVALVGCASMDTQTATPREAKEDKTVVTGSHIPSKKGTAGSVYSMEGQEVQDGMQRSGPSPSMQPMGK